MAKITYSANDRAIVAALKNVEDGWTLAELKEATGLDLKPGHVSGAVKKGLIAVIGDRDVERMGKGKVMAYSFVTADVLKNADGKDFNYTDKEKEVLAAAAQFDKAFTLAELGNFMGKKLSSGNLSGLIKKGNINKEAEMITVDRVVKSTVNVYGFVADVPEAE